MAIQIRYTDDNGDKVTYKPKSKVCPTGQHPICTGSDSNLAECVCWCAECKEMMSEIRKEYKKNQQAILQEIKEWA